MAAFGAIGAGISLISSIYGAYQANKAQEAEDTRQLKLLREQRAKEAFNKNKFLSEYNDEKLRRDVIRDGDFSKAGGIYYSMQNALENRGNIDRMRIEDDATKRGLENTGVVSQGFTDSNSGISSALATGMGQYAGGLQSNLGMLQGPAYDNTAYSNEMAISNQRYAENQPDFGNSIGTVTTYLDNKLANSDFNNRMDRVDNIFNKSKFNNKTNTKTT